MGHAFVDRCGQGWTGTTSTGGIVVSGSITGFKAWSNLTNGQITSYLIKWPDSAEIPGEVESGVASWNSGTNTLTVLYRIYPTEGGGAVTFSDGTKEVYNAPAGRLLGAPFISASDPTVNDDIGDGFVAGMSTWFNSSSKSFYRCVDHTAGAAVWEPNALTATGVTPGTYGSSGIPSFTVGTDGRLTAADEGGGVSITDQSGAWTGTANSLTDLMTPLRATEHASLFNHIDGRAAGDNITNITNSHAGQRIWIDQNTTVANTFGASFPSGRNPWVVIVNKSTTTKTLTITGGTVNGASSMNLVSGARVLIEAISNAGTAPVLEAIGDLEEINFDGRIAYGGLLKVTTVSGTLDATHIGRDLLTSGSVTIPTTTGWWAIIELGAATHDLTFNSTTLDVSAAGYGTGDILGVRVRSGTTIRVTRIAAADVKNEGDFV